jgi:4-amino-4-deoxy-L-arabinose transferase-like glycosyltransferase
LQRAPDLADWRRPALGIVVGVTLLRWVLLAFNRTDLFVDESQYWLWGQSFQFGYYSKPPLIAWVIGAVTWAAGSDATFWIRAPFALFHGVAALVLGALAARLYGGKVAVLVAAGYVTLPMVAVGSLLASTDTIMAPFFAAALYFHARLIESRTLRFALLAGVMAGLAFLAKYAAVYFFVGVGLGAMLLPALRIAPRHALAMLGASLVVILPNLWWNAGHGFATLTHTADNIRWVQDDAPSQGLNPAGLLEFFFSQFAVFGPVLFAALIYAGVRPNGTGRFLVFALPVIAIVCGQALMDRAYANWAASAYFAGTIAAMAILANRPRLLTASFGVNGLVALLLPLLTLVPNLTLGGEEPLLARYLGRERLSVEILAATKAAGDVPVVATRRDVLADLFYTGRDAGIAIYAQRPVGKPANHYEQSHPMPTGLDGQVLFVADAAPICNGAAAMPEIKPDLAGGAYQGGSMAGYLIDAACLDERP